MISEKSINDLSLLAGIDAEVITNAIKSEDAQDLKLVKTDSFTKDELTVMKDNIIKDNQGDYENAKKTGEEMLLKDLSKKIGIETTKNPDAFLEKYRDVIIKESGAEPNKKIEELLSDNEKLRLSLDDKNGALTNLEKEYSNKITSLKINNKLVGLTVGKLGALSKEDYVSLYLKDHNIIEEDGKIMLQINGSIVKDNLQNPIDPLAHYQDWLKSKGVEKKATGRGGDNMSGVTSDISGIKNRDELNAYFEKKGITDFNEKQAIMIKVIKNDGYKH